jgi:hypothetical protein
MVLRRTPGGQPFIVGGAAGDQEVWHFLATLVHGRETCDLPADFLAFESRKFYPTAQDIAAMPPCKATVIVAAPCYCMFRKTPSDSAAATATANEIFVIGDPGSKPLVWRFLSTLEHGQTCDLPAAFLAYQKAHPQANDPDE